MAVLAPRDDERVERVAVMDAVADLTTFECPRCGTSVSERFYGPCEVCRASLRSTFERGAENVDVPEYEPKMNVRPNHVATKD